MKLQRLRHFRGPNVITNAPVVEIILDAPVASGEALAQTLQRLLVQAKVPSSFLQAAALDAGRTLVAVECPHASLGTAAAAIGLRMLQGGEDAPTHEDLRRLQDLEYAQRLPASTAVVYHAARRRNIPARKLNTEYGRFLLLGHGARQHRCQASEPDSVSAVARTCSTDKYLAKELMAAAGVPVPRGRIVATADDAWDAAQTLGLPVAVKPQDSDLAIGVSLDLQSHAQVEAAFHAAREHSTWVIVERFAPGIEHRVLVVDGRIAAVTRIDPPQVVGDGQATVTQLVERVNSDPRRGEPGSSAPLARLQLDEIALGVLAAQKHSLASVPAAGERVLVRRNPPYFKHGGNLVDLTDAIHPSIAAHAAAAAQALQLRVAGLDVVALDIGRPLEEQAGVVVEINAGPGLWLHLAPWADSPRPVGDAIVASMFPPGDDGRIPVIALVSDDGANASARLAAAEMLRALELRLGSAGRTGIAINDRRWDAPADLYDRAQMLFQFPALDVAILETTPDELVNQGFANDRCDVVLNVASRTQVLDELAGPRDGLDVLRHAGAAADCILTEASQLSGAAVRRALGLTKG